MEFRAVQAASVDAHKTAISLGWIIADASQVLHCQTVAFIISPQRPVRWEAGRGAANACLLSAVSPLPPLLQEVLR